MQDKPLFLGVWPDRAPIWTPFDVGNHNSAISRANTADTLQRELLSRP